MFIFNLNVVFTMNFLKMAPIRVRFSPELEFTVVCLQVLVWIYVNAIHSRVFILDLPANIDF
jgi:hypothetical protein